MPSSVTEVPGSQGPRQSGSVMVPTDVPMQMSTISLLLLLPLPLLADELLVVASELDACFARLAGGDLELSSAFAELLLPVAGTVMV